MCPSLLPRGQLTRGTRGACREPKELQGSSLQAAAGLQSAAAAPSSFQLCVAGDVSAAPGPQAAGGELVQPGSTLQPL